MSKIEPQAIFVDSHSGREIHAIGAYVSVCFNVSMEEVRLKTMHRGRPTIATMRVPERDGKPYISFVSWEDCGDGNYSVDEDDSIEGGISAREAEKVARELMQAVAYIAQLSEEANG